MNKIKKSFTLFFILIAFFITTGFENADKLEITEIKTMIDDENRLLRYELQILNNSNQPIKSEFEYPGHHKYGIEMVIQPMESLAQLMVTEKNANYTKMIPLENGWKEYFEPGIETPFYVSYQIKEDVDIEEVKNHALDAKLLILDGVTTAKTVPLQAYKEKSSSQENN